MDEASSGPRPHNARDLRSANRPDRERSPEIDEDVKGDELDRVTRAQVRNLEERSALWVAKHLVMAGRLVDDDPELAFQHALAASRRGGRLAAVREAVGVTAYAAGHYGEALREFRTFRRISGSNVHLPVMADCERGLGRPDRALDLARSEEAASLDVAGKAELAMVVSGARTDLGQLDAAVAALEIPQLDLQRAFSFSPRLFRAYADALDAVGRSDESDRWRRQAGVAERALGLDDELEPDIIDLGDDDPVPVPVPRVADLLGTPTSGGDTDEVDDVEEVGDTAEGFDGVAAGEGHGVDEDGSQGGSEDRPASKDGDGDREAARAVEPEPATAEDAEPVKDDDEAAPEADNSSSGVQMPIPIPVDGVFTDGVLPDGVSPEEDPLEDDSIEEGAGDVSEAAPSAPAAPGAAEDAATAGPVAQDVTEEVAEEVAEDVAQDATEDVTEDATAVEPVAVDAVPVGESAARVQALQTEMLFSMDDSGTADISDTGQQARGAAPAPVVQFSETGEAKETETGAATDATSDTQADDAAPEIAAPGIAAPGIAAPGTASPEEPKAKAAAPKRKRAAKPVPTEDDGVDD